MDLKTNNIVLENEYYLVKWLGDWTVAEKQKDSEYWLVPGNENTIVKEEFDEIGKQIII